MYKTSGRHLAYCGGCGLDFEYFSESRVYAVNSLPLAGGGFYSVVGGKRWGELTLRGHFLPGEAAAYNAFLGALTGGFRELDIDGETFSGCTLLQSKLERENESQLRRFEIKIRSVENG